MTEHITDTITLQFTFSITGTKRQRVLAGLAIDDIVEPYVETSVLPEQLKELLAADGVTMAVTRVAAEPVKVRKPRGPNKPKVAAVPHVHAAAAD